MKNRKAIAAIIAWTSMMSVEAITGQAALSSTRSNFYSTNIIVNGTTITSPKHTVSWDGYSNTSFLPIWYMGQALSRIGIRATWDGNTLNLHVPSTFKVDMTNLPAHQTITANKMAIGINGTVVKYAPRIVLRDPAGGTLTTYAPIWYLEDVLNRLGIQSRWDGKNWTITYNQNGNTAAGQGMSQSGGQSGSTGQGSQTVYATKLDVVKAFAQALGIQPDNSGTNPYDDVSASDWGIVHAVQSYFPADSSTHFGSNDPITAEQADHAYQLYVGIPDSHMAWNAGGNTLAWANAIKLNNGVSTFGNMTEADLQHMFMNLENLNRGYSQNPDGSLQLWFKPYDAYTVFSQLSYSASFVASNLAKSIQMADDASIRQSGTFIIWKIDGVSESGPVAVDVGSDVSPSGTFAWYSLNNGATWTATTGYLGYDSTDPANGGRATAPSSVMVKTENDSRYDIGYFQGQKYVNFVQVDVAPGSNGVPTITYKAGMGGK
jgi:hypothetical protein